MQHQEKKEKSKWALPWIITLVLIAGLLGWLWFLSQRTVDKPQAPSPVVAPDRTDPAITAYLSFIDTGDNKMSLDHTLPNEQAHFSGRDSVHSGS